MVYNPLAGHVYTRQVLVTVPNAELGRRLTFLFAVRQSLQARNFLTSAACSLLLGVSLLLRPVFSMTSCRLWSYWFSSTDTPAWCPNNGSMALASPDAALLGPCRQLGHIDIVSVMCHSCH